MNTQIDYLSRYSFGHFCCRVKQGKRFSKFFQKYTDSGTETTHQAGYNILVFKYVKISADLPLLFIGAIRERRSKIRGKISLRDIAHKITFFQSLACFICLKRLLLRTLDVNIAKLCNI